MLLHVSIALNHCSRDVFMVFIAMNSTTTTTTTTSLFSITVSIHGVTD